MRYFWSITPIALFLFGCGQPVDPVDNDNNSTFGSTATFEVMTWNVENFPANGSTTVDYIAQKIYDLGVDVVGFQEIIDDTYFHSIASELNDLDSDGNWVSYIGNENSDYQELAYLVNLGEVELLAVPFEIYQSDGNAFPREPYVIQVEHSGQQFYVINNHLKCCGDGTLDDSDNFDEEYRRQRACLLLEEYIENNLADKNVIVIGDMNDILTDSESNNVFWNFLSQPNLFKFADMDIAEGSRSNFSYPNYDSHLDHILITDELFDEFAGSDSKVQTIKVDDELDGGWTEYEANISDHRPVAWRFTP